MATSSLRLPNPFPLASSSPKTHTPKPVFSFATRATDPETPPAEPAPESGSDPDEFDDRLSQVRLRYRSGTGKKAEIDRVFVADESYSTVLSTPENIFVNTNSNFSSSSIDLALYQTARIFNGVSHYTFPIRKQGRHWVRLYFSPFVQNSYNLSKAKFSVSAQTFTLLKDYQIEGDFVIKEYMLNITSSTLILTFTPSSNSFAFVNALEVVLLPDELIPENARTIGLKKTDQSLSQLALQTLVRVNMGNETVSPQNDTLWRFWDSDYSYLKHNALATYVSKKEAVKFSGSPTKYIAPSSVYGTATMLDTAKESRMIANLTWFFDVDRS